MPIIRRIFENIKNSPLQNKKLFSGRECFLENNYDRKQTQFRLELRAMKPVDIVRAQFDAFNAQDIDTLFDKVYSDKMEVYDLSGGNKRIFENLSDLKEHLKSDFDNRPPKLEILWIEAIGNIVNVFEQKSYPSQPEKEPFKMFALYEVADDRVSKIWIA